MDVDSDGPRGVKRKADTSRTSSQAPKRIKALEQDVVNKIAAGEIIVAPMHALKELIENAVDAGSTSIEIIVKEGGLKLLQITDNGYGINKDDLPILCERFTTSKLKAFEDLTSIGTYGFRGEALASISHIAHLTVTTRTIDSSCAFRAHYAGGKLTPAKPGQTPDPRPTAGRQGTSITVEDLFYNIRQRRQSFRSASEEFAKILDVVGRYAIHCSAVSFSCKKYGESAAVISTTSNAGTIDRIRQIHGSNVANELIAFSVPQDSRFGFKASGWTTNANYHVKRTTVLLFINHRSVESTAIRKAIDQTYSPFLPKGGHPFIYLDLEIEPHRVDVNVHPTKREVNFLHEDEIIDLICEAIRGALAEVDTSRTFTTQTLLPGAPIPTISSSSANTTLAPSPNVYSTPKSMSSKNSSSTPTSAQNPSTLVRTDSKLRKITSMLPPATPHGNKNASNKDDTTYEIDPDAVPTLCRLTSIRNLRSFVRSSMHSSLTQLFASHTYVGLVDTARRIVAIQSGVKLYLVDYGLVSNEYFYQIGLTDFGNFGRIKFAEPLDLAALVEMGVQQEKRDKQARKRDPTNSNSMVEEEEDTEALDHENLPSAIVDLLLGKRAMLEEYFRIEITDDGKIASLPLLVKGYTPSMAKLPRFLMRLGPYVDWNDEEACFGSFLVELASFYAVQCVPNAPRNTAHDPTNATQDKAPDIVREEAVKTPTNGNGHRNGNGDKASTQKTKREELLVAKRDEVSRVLEHVLFPAFRARLVATGGLLRGVVEVADLKGLYKVFERC
ncbi:DNA mismatch repair protein [Agyrium rufum]|nr:DNA mismatch repair protein [Agyrium rufum]